jgi:hypothetical protein
MTTIVTQIGLEFLPWSKQIQEDLSDLVVPLASDRNSWRQWACELIISNELWDIPLPTSLVFPDLDDWRRWANYFTETIYLNA